MRLRCVATKAQVAGLSVGPHGVMMFGRTVEGARYKICDENGNELDNEQRIELSIPFGDEMQELYAEVTIVVPMEIECNEEKASPS